MSKTKCCLSMRFNFHAIMNFANRLLFDIKVNVERKFLKISKSKSVKVTSLLTIYNSHLQKTCFIFLIGAKENVKFDLSEFYHFYANTIA